MSETVCPLCEQPVEKHADSTWKEVKGWVGGPRKDSMRLRADTGRYAHDDCVQKAQRGVAQDQIDLWEPAKGSGGQWETPVTVDNDVEELGLE